MDHFPPKILNDLNIFAKLKDPQSYKVNKKNIMTFQQCILAKTKDLRENYSSLTLGLFVLKILMKYYVFDMILTIFAYVYNSRG